MSSELGLTSQSLWPAATWWYPGRGLHPAVWCSFDQHPVCPHADYAGPATKTAPLRRDATETTYFCRDGVLMVIKKTAGQNSNVFSYHDRYNHEKSLFSDHDVSHDHYFVLIYMNQGDRFDTLIILEHIHTTTERQSEIRCTNLHRSSTGIEKPGLNE
jgi:hypothetical protein